MSFFISSALAQAPAAPTAGGSPLISFAMMGGMFALFYFLAIRPQRQKQKEHEQLLANLAKGDEVVTTSGILGRVKKLDDDYLVLQVAENMELKFQKSSVHAVLPKGTLKEIGT